MYFNSRGEAVFKQKSVRVLEDFRDPSYIFNTRPIGILFDRLNGTLSITNNSNFECVSFGFGSKWVSEDFRNEQW